MALRCPLGTAVSIQLAQYGRPAPGLALCAEPVEHSTGVMAGNFSESCTITPQMQVSSSVDTDADECLLIACVFN